MRRIAALVLVAALAAVGAASAQNGPPSKIGIFDAQRVSEETAEGKRVQAKLNAFRDKKQAELTSKEKEVQELQDRLNAQSLSLSPEKRGELDKDVQKKMLDLNQAREAAQREMQLEVTEAQNGFNEKLLSVINQFGRDEGFVLIIERSLAAYANPSTDVTTAIVDRFNKLMPAEAEPAAGAGEKPAAPPAKPPAAQTGTPDKK